MTADVVAAQEQPEAASAPDDRPTIGTYGPLTLEAAEALSRYFDDGTVPGAWAAAEVWETYARQLLAEVNHGR